MTSIPILPILIYNRVMGGGGCFAVSVVEAMLLPYRTVFQSLDDYLVTDNIEFSRININIPWEEKNRIWNQYTVLQAMKKVPC